MKNDVFSRHVQILLLKLIIREKKLLPLIIINFKSFKTKF